MKKKTIILAILIITWMSTVFYFSNQPGEISQDTSRGIVAAIVNKLDITDKSQEHETIARLDKIERKLAHYTIYLIGGILLFAETKEITKKENIKTIIVALTIGALYATTDEIHQLFIANRSGQITDVMLDTLGVGTGIVLYMLVNKIKSKNDRG